jgi:FkbM family methyltransferase
MWLLEKSIFYKKLSKVIIKNRILSNSSIVFDVGANRGQSIAFFKKMFPSVTILAFEPSPRVFLKLQKKWENKKNVSLFELALGATKGETVF